MNMQMVYLLATLMPIITNNAKAPLGVGFAALLQCKLGRKHHHAAQERRVCIV